MTNMQFFGDLPHEKEMAEAMQEFEETPELSCCGCELDETGICKDCGEHCN